MKCARIAPDLNGDECAAAMAMILPGSLPPSRGNAYADNPDAARFGFFNFYDKGFSRAGDVRCATCHLPEYAFQDRRQVAKAVGVGTRNTPTTLNAARLTVWFWDGRADSLWSQPLFAIESEREMNMTRLELAHHIFDDATLRGEYEHIFGALPELSDTRRFPLVGKPKDASFDGMAAADQVLVNRIAANVGKSFEAFLRQAVSGRSKVDDFLSGDDHALSDRARHGLAIFLRAGCVKCHRGPMLTDERFHDVGFPSLPGAASDPGRAAGAVVLEENPFNLQGPYADPVNSSAPPPLEDTSREMGAFRTPSLRHVAETAPYGHDGAFAQLSELMAFHGKSLSANEQADVIVFLTQLDGVYPPPPWNFWPQMARQ